MNKNKFIPINFKFKKLHHKLICKKSYDMKYNNLTPSFLFGLKILENGLISSVVFEAARRSITKKIKRTGVLKINGFPNIPITGKSLGIRMGKGVGSINKWVFPIKKGRILFELKNTTYDLAKAALRSASVKIPLKSNLIILKK